MGSDFQRENVADISNMTDKLLTSLRCKQIRIGTHRFEPVEMVILTCKGMRIRAPSCKRGTEQEQVHLNIYIKEIIKIITHFSKKLNIIFIYTLKKCGEYVRESLDMQQKPNSSGESPYYNPTDRLEPYKRIVLEIESITEESKAVIRSIFERSVIEKISHIEANELLKRASSKDKIIDASTSDNTSLKESSEDIRQILIYPPGKGGISINTEDYMCLGVNQYLNDVIIDFYLKYLYINALTPLEQNKTHIFSSFFYKRLTTTATTTKGESKSEAAASRHNRVKNWTKNTNLFEKDYIVIPINEQSHWFLAIVCFPNLKGPVNSNTNEPVKIHKFTKKKSKTNENSSTNGNKSYTDILNNQRNELEIEEESSGSDDNDSESGSDNSELENSSNASSDHGHYAIKQPLILIFDSLMGTSRVRVAAKLRDYLTYEYQTKMKKLYTFNKTNIPLQIIRVPQQENYTDCGLYLLQFVEHFFNNPIEDYHLPIINLSDWFDTIVVTRKREEISELLKKLVTKYNPEKLPLPCIPLPTQDGKLIELKDGSEKQDADISDCEEPNKEGPVQQDEEYLSTPSETVKPTVTRSMLKRTLEGILNSTVKKARSLVIIKD